MSAALDVLAQHIDQPDRPDQRHRCVLLDPRHLRCLDCARTLVLPTSTTTARSTSTSTSPPPLHAPTRCPKHLGQTDGACGPCRAEHLEARQQRPKPAPTADVAAGAAACRAALHRQEQNA